MAKQKIAILGGGVGSLTAAYELTSQPGWQDKYEITLYQMGWRLGGKGASGRNAAAHNRIEEHGLHIWMGFYENAFRMIREVYTECAREGLSQNSTFASWDQAFSREDFTPIMENYKGQWKVWPVAWPDFPGINPGEATTAPEPWDYVLRILEWLVDRYDSTPGIPPGPHTKCGILSEVEHLAAVGATEAAGTSLHVAHRVAHRLDANDKLGQNFLVMLIHDFLTLFRPVAKLCEGDDTLRRLWIILETGLTVIAGLIQDEVIQKGWRSIDNEDLIEWLARHGCENAKSPVTIGMYDACFAYRDGTTLSAAAGATLHGALRLMFTYKGAIMWHMNAGMGDTIFTPLYLLLRQRGVQFRFFQKVMDVHVESPEAGPDKASVTSIDIQVQATTQGEYNPLMQVGALKCWPNQPNWDQIEQAAEIRKCVNPDLESWWTDWKGVGTKTLRRGVDFD
ncbi:MAG: NAD(P)-binding protein, partial [Acidobacteriia bacterium]|nr:NAD(P)-binding protein [Terriglobia bacterium]